jgi:hypothetical protein
VEATRLLHDHIRLLTKLADRVCDMTSTMPPAASSLGLSQEELKAVELTRQRLFQLSNSIASLKADVYNSIPLPSLYVPTIASWLCSRIYRDHDSEANSLGS